MKIRKIIELVDRAKENAIDAEQKVQWIAELDGKIAADVFLMGYSELKQFQYTYPEALDNEPLVSFPHDDIYRLWLMAQIDLANGEYNKYQNSMVSYNESYGNFVRWFARVWRPAQGDSGCFVIREDVPQYYITAYGLAVRAGFTGTLEQWLESLIGPEGPVGPQGPQGPKGEKGDPYPRSINLGKLTNGEKAAISNTTPAECTQEVNPDADLHFIARWVYTNANVDISDYVDSIGDNFATMFDAREDAPLGEKYKLLERPSVMLLPGSYGGNEYMQAHGYRYTMQAQDYKTGDIFCASVKVYTKRGDLRDAYFMAISLGGNTYLACYNYGAGTPFTVTYAEIEDVEKITNGLWPYPGVGAGDDEECFPEYYYVLRPENVAAADAISLGKDFQGFKRETKAGLAECANAIKGSASGEVVALTDVSPIEHEMSVKVDVPGATVQKLGKNYALTSSANKPINMGAGSLLVSAKQLEAPLKAGHTYTLTADISCDNPDKVYLMQDSSFKTLGYFRNDGRQSLTFTVGDSDYVGLYFYGGKDLATSKLYAATFENITVCEGTPRTYNADENGIVRGIIGNGESMTLFSDTEGVTIEAEYNKDTNKVIESLVQAIISLGGNV